jgi:hypothetical protein
VGALCQIVVHPLASPSEILSPAGPHIRAKFGLTDSGHEVAGLSGICGSRIWPAAVDVVAEWRILLSGGVY